MPVEARAFRLAATWVRKADRSASAIPKPNHSAFAIDGFRRIVRIDIVGDDFRKPKYEVNMIYNVFRDKLLSGEEVIWSGQPRQGIFLTSHDGLLVPFSLVWGGFAVFWETSVLRVGNSPPFMKVLGIPFVLIAIYLTVGRFILDDQARKRMYYALTNQRILIVRLGPLASFTALSVDRLPGLTLTESSGGRGTIYFGSSSQGSRGNGFAGWTQSLDPTPKFLSVENAKVVFGLIQHALRRAEPRDR